MRLLMPTWTTLRERAAVLVGILLLSMVMNLAGASGPARFQPGKEVVLSSTRVGPAGATLRTGTNGTPVDGITIEIPARALTREATITLSYDTGKLTLPRGDASGVFLRIAAGKLAEFQEPLKINISYDPARWKGRVAVGYAIDEKGQLSAVDLGAQDHKAGTASFFTLVPLHFTWVYAAP